MTIFLNQPADAEPRHVSDARQVAEDETRVFPKHIQIHFLKDPADKLEFISKTLNESRFADADERALIFVHRRSDAEEYAELFGEKTDFYHAGRDAADKEDVAARFNSGDIKILFATKAFGMGVDIKNIRYVFHAAPPSSIEDYIQEIGRAGRDGHASHAYLPFSDGDFNDVRSRLIKSQLHWSMVKDLHSTLAAYRESLAEAERDSFVIPEDLIALSPSLCENLFGPGAAATRQRMLLHSLEEAERLEVGGFEVTHWPICLGEAVSSESNAGKIAELARLRGATATKSTLISERELSQELHLASDSDAREELFHAAKIGAVRILFEVALGWTNWATDDKNKLHVDPILQHGRDFFRRLTRENGDTFKIDQSEIHPSYLSSETAKKAKRDADPLGVRFDERKQYLIRFLRRVDGIRVTGNKRAGEYRFFTRSVKGKRGDAEDWKETLTKLSQRAESILAHLRTSSHSRTIDELYRAADAGLAKMRMKDLELTLQYLVALGVLHLDNSLIPAAVRIHIKEEFSKPFDTAADEEARELLHQRRALRIWRLDALQVLTRIADSKQREIFARDFFSAESVNDARQAVLDKAVEVDESLGRQFADAALELYYQQLTPEQKSVVQVSQTKNVIVQAGPGTGKTHTLINCIAQRILASYKIPDGRNPNGPIAATNILVLAYTRAVVEELRDRLRRLLRQLGRNEIPQIHTFHSYALMKLSEVGRRDIPLEKVIEEFETTFKSRSLPGAPAHVFVDEFQDITLERTKMLIVLSNQSGALFTAIGDPDQSIYEYEKGVANNYTAESYFKGFKKKFDADAKFLFVNFRSDKAILHEANGIFQRNLVPGPMAREGAVTHAPEAQQPLERYAVDSLANHRQVAVLFRTNAELYRARPDMRQIPNVALRVLGGQGKIVYSREINECLEKLLNEHARETCSEAAVRAVSDTMTCRSWEPRLLRHLVDGAALFSINQPNRSIADFVDWVRGDLNGNHLLYASQCMRAESLEPELILSTMHRTKGLEFDSVIVSPSQYSLDAAEIQEEKRLRYVAITRARHELSLIDGPREAALHQGHQWQGENWHAGQRFDTIDEDGKGAFRLFDFSGIQNYLLEEIREGDSLEIRANAVWHNRQRLCGIASSRHDLRSRTLHGLFVTEIVRNDGFGPDDKYKLNYTQEAQDRGWSYIVNAAGYLA